MPTLSPLERDRVERVLDAIAHVAVEFEADLDVHRLAGLVDLYAHALRECVDDRDWPTFEAFVGSPAALTEAARLAERDSGIPTVAPPPLRHRPDRDRPIERGGSPAPS